MTKKSEKLNDFFASVFTKENIHDIPTREQETNIEVESVSFTKNIIRDKIKGLKANSASGPDGICTNILQNAKEELLEPLKIIFESTLSTGTVPKDW